MWPELPECVIELNVWSRCDVGVVEYDILGCIMQYDAV